MASFLLTRLERYCPAEQISSLASTVRGGKSAIREAIVADTIAQMQSAQYHTSVRGPLLEVSAVLRALQHPKQWRASPMTSFLCGHA